MQRLSDLMNVHLKETEAVIAQSNLLLQKPSNGQSGELKSSGNLVENYVRDLLKKIAPDSIHISSGYIVNPDTFNSTENLSQHDILLSHKMIPPIFSIVNGEIDIIPIESFVGLIEVKRNLNKKTLKDAQEHIVRTYKDVIEKYKSKNSDYQTVSITNKPGTNAPLLGIIGLTSDLNLEEIREIIDPLIIDFVWALKSEESYIVCDKNGGATGTVSRKDLLEPLICSIEGTEAIVFSRIKGVLSLWLSTLSSKWMKADSIKKYYFDYWHE